MNVEGNYNDYFTKFIIVLMDLFRTDRALLEARGSFIIRFVYFFSLINHSQKSSISRQLCMLLSPEDIYKTLSETIANEPDSNFASIMVKILSSILLTSTELHDLRVKLKNIQSKESADLFVCLYKTWCHNPIALVALCFLSQNYDHACTLVQLL
jgi:vacuole morphology and inheritance protein 14